MRPLPDINPIGNNPTYAHVISVPELNLRWVVYCAANSIRAVRMMPGLTVKERCALLSLNTVTLDHPCEVENAVSRD